MPPLSPKERDQKLLHEAGTLGIRRHLRILELKPLTIVRFPSYILTRTRAFESRLGFSNPALPRQPFEPWR